MVKSPEEILVYVGTYVRGGEESIFLYRLNAASGGLEPLGAYHGGDGPSFLAIHPNKRSLYAVNDVSGSGEGQAGALAAFDRDPNTGALALLNRQSTLGPGPCHVSVEATGRYALVANYSGGSVCMLPIAADGRLGEACDFVQHQGSGPDLSRQEGPHAHSIMPDPGNRYAFAPDLGLDQVVAYQLDLVQGKLGSHSIPYASVPAGAGPRHMAFHPNGRLAYVINELDSTMTVMAYDASQGVLKEIQTLSTLPQGYQGTSYCADVHVLPSGRFVYGSNRGHDSIAILAVDERTGKLTLVGCEPTQGEFPRNFAIDPTATFLLAANQNSDDIVSFRIDAETGRLTPTGQVTRVSTPVCLKMITR